MKCTLTGATCESQQVQPPRRAIAEVLGYKHCTAVQAESLGPLLSGADMVVKAKTGTGKTLAFLIPGIEQVGTLSISWDRCMGGTAEAGVSVKCSK